MLEITPSSLTVFERVWQQPRGHLFRSERHGVMAVADPFGKLPFQVVIAPRDGTLGTNAHFAHLPATTRRKLHEVSDALSEKILQHCSDEQRVIAHTEGFGVPDHPHIVLFAAERQQGKELYDGSPLGQLAVSQTLKLLTLTPAEASLLEVRLDEF